MPAMRGPAPTHCPNFPSEFLAEAQAFPRQRKVSFQLRQRAALVCLLHDQPQISHSEAAAEVQMGWIRSAVGGVAGHSAISLWKTNRDAGASPIFPPLDQATVKALACEVVCETETPLSRQSVSDLTQRACVALRKPISRSTVWRLLHQADLQPWQYEYWIFPRDPHFAEKAEVILD